MTAENQVERTLTGRVTSNKMDKTITVAIERLVKHPVYGKYIRRTTKLHAHDEHNRCHEGDMVTIKQCRPLSKSKSWMLVDVVRQAQ
ncbi:MAG TPA: 30S ribosomal protein S17 [Candidatus Competibacter phosphatis]|jgi:small subunit ribosomal protein S17|uniref:Small ribosomal subunit protein uS17 n=1 Tax=Candidatus Competibacter phosphatis TaxID=221280 RepID=A0ABX1TMG6_9GAMM|nr:30S ribosomal protein S17 [Candidatus Competibacter phosphatis]MCA9887359.1 30S ribosomal protein S17 [Anaerolineae bacterium]MCP5449068.1 30S ribosomal protein S17 [Gammaproteobacteria bacterium]MDG4559984.1 30S ribosomal protein S17 [Candidatus Competibacter sp.]NMQ19869.1 30S ribosomal protein S17 [Candidatus Competibacter phosphatis]HMQ12098.1 30S ribosomal protein S17 [Candidatus Competibacter phosphatis]